MELKSRNRGTLKSTLFEKPPRRRLRSESRSSSSSSSGLGRGPEESLNASQGWLSRSPETRGGPEGSPRDLSRTLGRSPMDHVHVKARSTSRSNPSKMACEKASRRLRTVLFKASRLGVNGAEVANLTSAKRLLPRRDHGWKLAVFLVLMLAGGVIVALVCTAREGCSRIEDINLAT
ncbi:uncharacterized protein LOC105704461 [Orussus abietinus]|uniref:uncharacterized protein LOC105704461 n=1 Tax=Orussus abietinus TaxID=222816 RepID=UPI000624FA5A|nr:uncharacterized protein LOC105704461 [Orussus abietinus]